MTIQERVRPAATYKPEVASLNLGAMNFGLFGMLIAPLAWIGRAVPDFGIEVQEVLQSGDRWIVRSVMFGTPVGRFLGLDPTGRSFSFQAIHIHRLVDGLIAETWHVDDMAGAARGRSRVPRVAGTCR